MTGELVFLGPTELKQLKRQFLAFTISGPDSRLKHTSNLPVGGKKKPINLSWRFSLRDKLQVCHISKDYRGALREYRLGDAFLCVCSFLVSVQFSGTSQEGIYTLI